VLAVVATATLVPAAPASAEPIRQQRVAGGTSAAGRDPQYGYGVVNLIKALTADVPSVATNPLVPTASAQPSSSTRRPTGGPGPVLALALAVACGVLVIVVPLSGYILVRSRRRRTRG
jgi:hypothetical protein